ncbi:DEAD/DEAH box helicase [Catenibacterium sp.]|uniref:DEAD/DEAH box helicase n=1 Tax=Catenibacterium sp. TaxID=2049022 RepID=UPI002E78F2FC|nr:helicase-related protein [Catenibacterium sp.]
MRTIQARKAFINNHPKKLEIARKIIEARPSSKIITFSNNIKMAESIGMGGKVFSGRDSKKKGRTTIEEFSKESSGILHTVRKADEGLDVPGLSVAIILGLDSSKIRKVQRIGRVVRKEGDKKAEIFTLVIDQTVETEWLFYKDFIE